MRTGLATTQITNCLVSAIYVMLATGFAMHVPELFPTRFRLRGTAICATSGRIATALVQFAVVAIFAWQGLLGVLGTLAGILIFQALVFFVFGFETKGRGLEKVADTTENQATASAAGSDRPCGRLAQRSADPLEVISKPAVCVALIVASMPVHHPGEWLRLERDVEHPKVFVH